MILKKISLGLLSLFALSLCGCDKDQKAEQQNLVSTENLSMASIETYHALRDTNHHEAREFLSQAYEIEKNTRHEFFLDDIRNHLHKEPKIKLLERLISYENNLELQEHKEYFLRLISLLLEHIPKKTLSSYQSLHQKLKPFEELITLGNINIEQQLEEYQQALEKWQKNYPQYASYQKFLPEQKLVLSSSLVHFKEISFIAKEIPSWFDEFVSIFSQKFPEKTLSVQITSDLGQALQLEEEKQILALCYGFKVHDFSSFEKSLPLSTLLLSDELEPTSERAENLWVFHPAHLRQYKKLKDDLCSSQATILLERDAFSHDKLSFLEQFLQEEEIFEVNEKNYQQIISQLLQIPEREKHFQKIFGAQINYHPLPSKNFNRVFLLTSPEIARLSYPYWRLKSQSKTKFYGLSELRQFNPNLDSALKGMYLASSSQDYNPRALVDLLEHLPELVVRTTYTFEKEKFSVYLQKRDFIEETSFQINS